MAPVSSHQYRQVILPPRPAKGPPGGARVVNNLINLKTFLALLLGSFCIFIVGVLIWKFGAFLRCFSRGKVVGGGKAASIRYAKTWHGWVPRSIHDNRLRIRRERLNAIRDKFAWRTSHADYSWVWWDPGGFKFHQHRQNQQRLRIVPPQLLSYQFDGPGLSQTDAVVLPPHSNSRGLRKQKNSRHTTIYSYLTSRGSAPYTQSTQQKRQLPTGSGLGEVSLDESSSNQPPNGIWIYAKRHLNALLPPLPFAYAINRPSSAVVRSRSLPDAGIANFCSSRAFGISVPRKIASEGQGGEDTRPRFFVPDPVLRKVPPSSGPKPIWPTTNSWRFKAWAARMQRSALIGTPPYLRGLAGRPGTPVTGVLQGMVSSAAYPRPLKHPAQSVHQTKGNRAGTDLEPKLDNGANALGDDLANYGPRANGKDGRFTERRKVVLYTGSQRNAERSAGALHPRSVRRTRSSSAHDISGPRVEEKRLPLRRHLSNPEIRLMDDLGRKLDWLSSEMDPGRKPFHFAVCHNHWLNRATWVVLDPVSRVGVKTRRLYGDPRVNYPHAHQKGNEPASEHFETSRRHAHTPNINSWRLAVNSARKRAGAMDILKIVELFDGSAEEVRESIIDPASWVLKKPPQGYSLTKKQRDAYFEGCGGWCEKLEDWQQVPRAYRARRVILEGKANRRRAAEIANAVGGNCRKAARKITPIWLSTASFSVTNQKRAERRERSGRGSIRKRMSTKGRTQKAGKVSRTSHSEHVGQGNRGRWETGRASAAEQPDTG